MGKPTKVLIDGDIFRYRCAFAAERTKYLVELVNASGHREYKSCDSKKDADAYGERVTQNSRGSYYVVWSRKDLQPLENCLQIVKSSIENALDDIRNIYAVKTVEYSIWLSGKTNYREAIATSRPYKGNRDNTPKPTYYKDVGEYLVASWGAVYTEGIEADDAIGIAAMEAKAAGQSYVVVSNDKDLIQIPGLHYNWVSKEFRDVSAKEAKQHLFSQILSGDATDNIPGLDGVGPATAAQILEGAQSPEEMVDRVVQAYRESETCAKMDMWADDYLKEQWALVYILKKATPNTDFAPQYEHWFQTKEGKYFLEKYGT